MLSVGLICVDLSSLGANVSAILGPLGQILAIHETLGPPSGVSWGPKVNFDGLSVDFGLSIGLSSDNLITALLLVQFIGFPAALVFGRLGERYGAQRGIWVCIWVYVGVTIYAFFMEIVAIYMVCLFLCF